MLIKNKSLRYFSLKIEDYNKVCTYNFFWGTIGQDIHDPTSADEDLFEETNVGWR
jgi:hypothetical protein